MMTRPVSGQFQSGISLVEIMIALLLSLVLMAGVIQVYVSNKQTYLLQDELARVQENGRFAIEVLQRSIRGAGFENEGQAFNTANTLDVGMDSIGIVSSGTISCLGANVAAVDDRYFVDGNNNLSCTDVTGAQTQPLVQNVQNMQILYGVDTDGNRTADLYLSATQVNAPPAPLAGAQWANVVSVRIGLLLSTSTLPDRGNMVAQPMVFDTVAQNPLLAVFDVDNDGTPEMFDTNADGTPDTNIAPDNRLYRVFTTTITLRNRVF